VFCLVVDLIFRLKGVEFAESHKRPKQAVSVRTTKKGWGYGDQIMEHGVRGTGYGVVERYDESKNKREKKERERETRRGLGTGRL
jgi:hypothetical protein